MDLYALIFDLKLTLVISSGFGPSRNRPNYNYTLLPAGFLFFITIAQKIIHITNTNSTIL